MLKSSAHCCRFRASSKYFWGLLGCLWLGQVACEDADTIYKLDTEPGRAASSGNGNMERLAIKFKDNELAIFAQETNLGTKRNNFIKVFVQFSGVAEEVAQALSVTAKSPTPGSLYLKGKSSGKASYALLTNDTPLSFYEVWKGPANAVNTILCFSIKYAPPQQQTRGTAVPIKVTVQRKDKAGQCVYTQTKAITVKVKQDT